MYLRRIARAEVQDGKANKIYQRSRETRRILPPPEIPPQIYYTHCRVASTNRRVTDLNGRETNLELSTLLPLNLFPPALLASLAAQHCSGSLTHGYGYARLGFPEFGRKVREGTIARSSRSPPAPEQSCPPSDTKPREEKKLECRGEERDNCRCLVIYRIQSPRSFTHVYTSSLWSRST